MTTFTLKITEAGRVLGETEIALPVLRFVPETAATVTPREGEAQDLLGWAGGLWAPMREPGRPGDPRTPLTIERFAELSNAKGWSGNPFAPNRFTHPITENPRLLLGERTLEIERETARLAVIGGHVHRMVDEPVYVQLNGPDGLRVDVRFRDPSSQAADMTWGVFRADRTDDARDFAQYIAKGMRTPYAGFAAEIRVVYPQVLKVDDVQLAFEEAFGRIGRYARSPQVDARLIELSERGRGLTADGLGFENAGQAEEAYALLREMRVLLGTHRTPRDMVRSATVSVASHVADRYDAFDREWLAQRDAAPSFAP